MAYHLFSCAGRTFVRLTMDMPVPALVQTSSHPLDRLAAALGIQDHEFSDPTRTAKSDSLKELLRLWEATPNAPARNRILAAARREAAQYDRASGITRPDELALNAAIPAENGTTTDILDPLTSKVLSPTLERIAHALGLPIAMFSDLGVIRAQNVDAELNRLWEALDCEASRQAILNVARVLIASQKA